MTVSFSRAKEVRDEAELTGIEDASLFFNVKINTVKSYITLAKRVDVYDSCISNTRKELTQLNDKYNKLIAEFKVYKNRGLFDRIMNK